MAMPEPMALDGCAPKPLASYLKALGVLRLLSSPINNVTGEAADPHVRGWWENERFHLRTRLTRDDVLRFFLEDYAPSPIIAPWNGGSGFYPKDNKDGFAPMVDRAIGRRFNLISSSIRCAAKIVDRLGLKERPQGQAKFELVSSLRSELPDPALAWLDAALALSGQGPTYPPLLGTGGNDGRLDFTNNFLRRLVSKNKKNPIGIFDAADGAPVGDARPLLLGALFSTTLSDLHSASIGQFSPGAAGGPNGTTGYEADSKVNPWEFVLMLEGAAAFAGTASRRHQCIAGSGASFPFTVRTVGAGWGGIEAADENDARAEFWAPLWARPSRSCELDSLFGEGRAVLNGRTARDGVEFARAAKSLGVSRGVSHFERFGFLMRSGKAYLATPIGRCAAIASPSARLVADLDTGGWLERARRAGREDGRPNAARQVIKQFEDAIFGLLQPALTSNCVRTAIVALGKCVEWLAISADGRQSMGSPPPLLSSIWIRQADDGTPEFRVAVALASLGLSPMGPSGRSASVPANGASAVDPAPTSHDETQAETPRSLVVPALPMAAHFAPIDEKRFFNGTYLSKRRGWHPIDSPPTVVWGSGSLVSNMIAILERRMVEATMRGLPDKPLAGAAFARAADVAAFIEGDFDDARCAALLAGLVWAAPARLSRPKSPDGAPAMRPPFAYAALKPLFSPDAALRRTGALDSESRLPLPPGLLARLRAGGSSRDGRTIDEAIRTALARARASGLASPFDPAGSYGHAASRIGAGIRADRLAASLLIPIGEYGLKALLARVSPESLPHDNFPTEETTDAA